MKSRGQKGLAIRYRPATLSEFLGHENLKTAIRKKFSLEKHPSAILFSGSTGSGKTTLARILALALNCPHQKVFGDPCLDCRKLNRDYDITEIPASDSTGINEIRASTEGYLYTPMPPSRVRVYILDEAQRLSGSAQDFLLKPFEDGPATTLWIICTTNPNKILPALRGRCIHWVIPSFRAAQIEELVLKVYEIEKEKGYTTISLSEKDIGIFTENLLSVQAVTPRAVLMNLEKLLVSGEPDCVFETGGELPNIKLGQEILRGNWNKVREVCKGMSAGELVALRNMTVGYLRVVLLEQGMGSYASKLAHSISDLTETESYEESLSGGKIIKALYAICYRFKQ